MKLRYLYDPFLRKSVNPITLFDGELKKIAAEMLKIMKKNNGIGLSGNQVGFNGRIVVASYEPRSKDDELPRVPETILINPKIVKSSQEKKTMIEGCLSFPSLELSVLRPSKVIIDTQSLTGKPITLKTAGLLARVLQHEIDHLDGIIFSDKALDVKNIEKYQETNIVFIGTDRFSEVVFNQITKANLGVMAVITEVAKPSGRGQILIDPTMVEVARKASVAVFQAEDTTDVAHILRQIKPDLVVLASFGKILTQECLDIPVYGCLNVHPSLLPKYRGATPIQSAILNNETETGVTIMKMSAQVDAGEIVSQEKITLDGTEATTILREKLAEIGASLLIETLPTYLSGQSKLTPQPPITSKTCKLTKEMGEIDWDEEPNIIERKIRALNPWPGTFTWLGDKRLKILEAVYQGQSLGLSLRVVQLEGKRPSDWNDFVRGHKQKLTKTDWYGKLTK